MMARLHRIFNRRILPVVEGHARRKFGADDDKVQEARALAWKWCRRQWRQGKRPQDWAGAIATFAARAVRSGRKLTGMIRSKDALNEIAWRRFGFTVSPLPDFSTLSSNPFSEALADHGQAPVPDHVAFRCDWPTFLAQQSARDQRMAELLGRGERANVVARQIGVSPGRLTQLRQALMRRWCEFHGGNAA